MKNLFRRDRDRRSGADATPPAAPHAEPVRPARPTAERPAPTAPLSVHVYARTDPGCERTLNEDAVRYTEPPPGAEARGLLVVLADGMGGHAAGEVASQTAVDHITERYYTDLGRAPESPNDALARAFREANATIFALSQHDPSRRGMGTTATALAVLPDGQAVHAQVGDSHLYLLRGGVLYLLSEDHSLVMEMVRQGTLTRAEASHSDERNVILRALGTHARVEVSAWPRPLTLRPGDRLLLCSDGLYELVDEDTLQKTLEACDGPAATEALVARARAGGGPDNISVALLTVDAMIQQDTRNDDAPARPNDPPSSLRPTRAVPQPVPPFDAAPTDTPRQP